MAKQVSKKLESKFSEPKWNWEGDPIGYADYVHISANERQIVLSFGQMDPITETLNPVSRVILHPKTAVELLAILVGSIKRYEQMFESSIIPEGIFKNEKE